MPAAGGVDRGLAGGGPHVIHRSDRSALPARVALDDREAERFELGDDGLEPPVVVEKRLVVVELVPGQQSRDGLAANLAGPGEERPVEPGWVVVAGASRLAAVAGAHDDAAGQARAEGGELGA